ncbi:MAG: type II toxin-antitoxin system prevent-host-death family antitoxin [Deltaproteobacteria bacterium]|nr:type II toxin-antitoxin system prevent-host-death family antitoxin [Deltaproteobacteria bacterium]
MQFVTVRDLRGKSSTVWKKLQTERQMIITSNGKPIAVLSAVSETNLEETLMAIRRSVAVVPVNSMQDQSVRSGLDKLPLKEINEAIATVRRGNKA